MRDAGAVLHSHSLNAVLATLIDESAKEFTVTHLEMIKVRRQGLCTNKCAYKATLLEAFSTR